VDLAQLQDIGLNGWDRYRGQMQDVSTLYLNNFNKIILIQIFLRNFSKIFHCFWGVELHIFADHFGCTFVCMVNHLLIVS
jgi:hypothetical protein